MIQDDDEDSISNRLGDLYDILARIEDCTPTTRELLAGMVLAQMSSSKFPAVAAEEALKYADALLAITRP